MPMISYAQNREDVLLRRFFSDREDGFYIDVGANDPVQHSVTKHFYDRGWRGINIEPDNVPYTSLCSQRQRDVNLNVGLSSSDTTLEFLECPSNPELSTYSPEMADLWHKQGVGFVKRTVPVVTLARVCEDHVDRPIDFLKIDAEAHEREVIEGGDWGRWRPRVILIEETRPDQWEPLLLAADYLFAAFDGLNRYYVRAEDRRLISLFNAPVCHYDGKEVINLASNNYLGLANHPKLIQAAMDATRIYGVGSGAVRTIAGTMRLHMELEEKIACFKNVEACVVFQSGFTANAGTVSSICRPSRRTVTLLASFMIISEPTVPCRSTGMPLTATILSPSCKPILRPRLSAYTPYLRFLTGIYFSPHTHMIMIKMAKARRTFTVTPPSMMISRCQAGLLRNSHG